jgi:hypothetical protein
MPSRSPGTHAWLISTTPGSGYGLGNSEDLTHRRQGFPHQRATPPPPPANRTPSTRSASDPVPTTSPRASGSRRSTPRLRPLPTVGLTEYGGIEYGGLPVNHSVFTLCPNGLHHATHGSTASTPVSTKSSTLRVASPARQLRQIAAICASAILIGRPACSREATISA